MKTAEELWGLLEQATEMPYGLAQIATFDQILRHVDGPGNPDLAFTTRLWATTAYVYGGEPVKAFATFSWCVSDFDRNPAPYHERSTHNLLWLFKTMVGMMTRFPEVPLDRTYAVLDDMERRYREGGHSMQAVHKHRYKVADHVGLAEEADRWFERWQATPRDGLSDCEGCDPSGVAGHLQSRGRYAEVVKLAEPVLSGRLACTEQPQSILHRLMIAYVKTGEPEKAADAHRRAYRLERDKLADLWDIGTHIKFCALTGNEHRGLEILQRHVDWLEKAPSPAAEMFFAADAALLTRRLTELGHGDLTIRRQGLDDVTAADLATEMAARARALAVRFDARNGTTHQSTLVEEEINAEPYGVDLVLSPTARPHRRPAAAPSPEPAPEPPAEIPAGAGPAELLDLAREHSIEDRAEALVATLDAFDARFGEPADPLLAGRRLVLRGDALRATRPDEVMGLWERAAELLAAAGATGLLTALRARMALEKSGDGVPDEAPVLAEVAYQEEHGDALERANAWARLTIVRFAQERVEESIESAGHALRHASEAGRPRLVAMANLLRSRSLAAVHRHDEARAAARAAWEFHRDRADARRAEVATVYAQLVDDPAEQVALFGETVAAGITGPDLNAYVGRGRALIELGRAAEAIPDFIEAVALSDERELPEASAFARHELANAYRMAERPVEAAETAEEALLRLDRLGFDEPADNCRFLLTGLYRAMNDNEAALAGYRELIERLADNPAGRGQIGEQLAGLLFDIDRDAEAAAAFEAAAADLRTAGDLVGELRLLRRRVGALHYADEPEAGEDAVRLVHDRFSALPAEVAAVPDAIWQHAVTAFEAGRLRMSRGRYADAVPDLRAAVGRLRELGAEEDANRLDGMLGEALLRSGSPAEAERLLAALLRRLPADAPDRELATGLHEEAVRAKS